MPETRPASVNPQLPRQRQQQSVCACAWREKLWETFGGFSSKLHISEQTFAHREGWRGSSSTSAWTSPVSQTMKMVCSVFSYASPWQHLTAKAHGVLLLQLQTSHPWLPKRARSQTCILIWSYDTASCECVSGNQSICPVCSHLYFSFLTLSVS